MNRVDDRLIHCAENEPLVRGFVDAQIEFVVIGGLAVAWHCPSRQADDLDLLVNPSITNSMRIMQVLHRLGVSGHSEDSFSKAGRRAALKRFQYADILTPQENGPQFHEVARGAESAILFELPVRVASAQSLLALKLHAVSMMDSERLKHAADVVLLRNAIDEARPRQHAR